MGKIIGSIVTGIVVIVGLIMLPLSIEKIPAGYEGVVYSMNGGVEDETLSQGWKLISPTKKVKEFTVSNEQLILSKDKREGSTEDDSFTVATSDNAMLSISFQMSYRFKPETLVETYKRFRGMDGEDIVENRVKTVLKSKISEVTKNYSMMGVYSENRAQINEDITKYLNEKFTDSYGIEVLDASIIDVHPDAQLEESIKNRVTALQQKEQAQAEQETAKVDAETNLIKAQNKADMEILQAETDAKAETIAAEAEANANALKAASITPDLIAMKEAEAREIHGWVTTYGADAIVKEQE